MKKLLTYTSLVFVLLFPAGVSAQGGTQVQNVTQGNAVKQNATVTPKGSQVQNSNQVQTQNMGEETQLMVATQQMQQLMTMEGLTEEVGNKVKNVAQEQMQAQSQIQTQLDKMESKQGLMKSLFGPDLSAINGLNQQVEQNRLRIQTLQQLQNQLVNQADKSQLQEAIQALLIQNVSLQEQINTEMQSKSLFGWLVKLFYK